MNLNDAHFSFVATITLAYYEHSISLMTIVTMTR